LPASKSRQSLLEWSSTRSTRPAPPLDTGVSECGKRGIAIDVSNVSYMLNWMGVLKAAASEFQAAQAAVRLLHYGFNIAKAPVSRYLFMTQVGIANFGKFDHFSHSLAQRPHFCSRGMIAPRASITCFFQCNTSLQRSCRTRLGRLPERAGTFLRSRCRARNRRTILTLPTLGAVLQTPFIFAWSRSARR